MTFFRFALGAALVIGPMAARNQAAPRYGTNEARAAGPDSPRVIVLHDASAGLEAAVAPSEGGELTSLRVQYQGKWVELLYRARDYSAGGGWRGKAQFLWPAVGGQYPLGTEPKGACTDGDYLVEGDAFTMPCHGFAKTMAWELTSHSADELGAHATVTLRDSEQTRGRYPFGFTVSAIYTLALGRLEIRYSVQASSENHGAMPFSIGNHIGFRVPFLSETDAASMTFESPSTIEMLRNAKGVLSGEQRSRSFATSTRLDEFSAVTAIPLTGYSGLAFARLRDPGGVGVRIAHKATSLPNEPLVRFNIYGGPRQGYFAPEPWVGLQNSLNTGVGRVELAAGGEWNWDIDIQPEITLSEKVEKVAGGFTFLEGPAWAKDGSLIFSDIPANRILRWSAGDGTSVYRDRTNAANGNALDAQGRLYSCERDGRRVVRMETDGRITVIADKWNGERLNSPNDVAVSRTGHVYFTDPASPAILGGQKLGFNSVYHVTPNGALSLVTRSMARPNGVALSPDGRTLYVADSTRRSLTAFALDADGNPGAERLFVANTPGTPDGLRVDPGGSLWIATGGIAIYTSAGELKGVIAVPEAAANCTFGGTDGEWLYITARTSIYRVRTARFD
jgi:gluconolactonase